MSARFLRMPLIVFLAGGICSALTSAAPAFLPTIIDGPYYDVAITLDRPPSLDSWSGITAKVKLLKDQKNLGISADISGVGVEAKADGEVLKISGARKGQTFTAKYKIRPYMIGWLSLTYSDKKIYFKLDDQGKFMESKPSDEVDGVISRIWDEASKRSPGENPRLTREEHERADEIIKTHKPKNPPPVITARKLVFRDGGKIIEIAPPPALGMESKVSIMAIDIYRDDFVKNTKLNIEPSYGTSFEKIKITEIAGLSKSEQSEKIYETHFSFMPITAGEITLNISRTIDSQIPEDAPTPRKTRTRMPFYRLKFILNEINGKLVSVNDIKVQP